jgi:hypothetical protein
MRVWQRVCLCADWFVTTSWQRATRRDLFTSRTVWKCQQQPKVFVCVCVFAHVLVTLKIRSRSFARKVRPENHVTDPNIVQIFLIISNSQRIFNRFTDWIIRIINLITTVFCDVNRRISIPKRDPINNFSNAVRNDIKPRRCGLFEWETKGKEEHSKRKAVLSSHHSHRLALDMICLGNCWTVWGAKLEPKSHTLWWKGLQWVKMKKKMSDSWQNVFTTESDSGETTPTQRYLGFGFRSSYSDS